jgi:ribokinase
MIDELAARRRHARGAPRQAHGVALIVVDAEGENQIAVCEGANGEVSLDGVVFRIRRGGARAAGDLDGVVAALAATANLAVNAARLRACPPRSSSVPTSSS